MTTKEKLEDVLKSVNGEKETVCIIYCDSDNQVGSIGFVGDLREASGSLISILEKVCRMECVDSELAIANSIIQAVAAVDYRSGGDFLKLIKEVEKENRKNANNELPN